MYDLKDTVKPPNRYLGANLGNWQFQDGSTCWWMNGRDYVANAIKLTKSLMVRKGKESVLGEKSKRPMSIN